MSALVGRGSSSEHVLTGLQLWPPDVTSRVQGQGWGSHVWCPRGSGLGAQFLPPRSKNGLTSPPNHLHCKRFKLQRKINLYLPNANEVWGKVMFSQGSVCLSTGRMSSSGSRGCVIHTSRHTPGHTHPGHTYHRGQQAGSTHPTGMLSCYDITSSP